MQGGASRERAKSPKHSLSFRFREEYGAGRLKEELFPNSDVENFNSIALRAGYNNSWIHSNSAQRQVGSMIRDQWMRESMRDIVSSDDFQKNLQTLVSGGGSDHSDLLDRVHVIVQRRLDELTPRMVKEIIQQMIRDHLGWLVVWGGVCGGLIGLIASFL